MADEVAPRFSFQEAEETILNELKAEEAPIAFIDRDQPEGTAIKIEVEDWEFLYIIHSWSDKDRIGLRELWALRRRCKKRYEYDFMAVVTPQEVNPLALDYAHIHQLGVIERFGLDLIRNKGRDLSYNAAEMPNFVGSEGGRVRRMTVGALVVLSLFVTIGLPMMFRGVRQYLSNKLGRKTGSS